MTDRMNRRAFLTAPVAVALGRLVGGQPIDLATIERARVLRLAGQYLRQQPVTITASSSPRSAGGRHDYFSEGDYWWPDPANPDGPYVQRDGMSNPGNFNDHRLALIRLSLHVPALAAAWRLTREPRFPEHAVRHLRAWFVDEGTRMNPHLLYAQAIKGRVTGRGIGIIDTLHLVEVARAISSIEDAPGWRAGERDRVRDWFARYLEWMTTHEYGIAEREAKNNHGTCWVVQVAEFARYTGNGALTAYCRDRFKTVLVPNQMAPDGSFPEERRRTKPYGYSLFNLDAMTAVCQILSMPLGGAQGTPPSTNDNLWTWQLPDGRGVGRALEFMVPFIADKSKWPHKPDVMYFDEWPVRHHSLLFGGLALARPEWIALWRKLEADPGVDEVVRNYFIRQPVLWIPNR
jgi:hypothetical protein